MRVAVFLGCSAIGLLVAAWLIPGVSVSVSAFLGGIGLVSTPVALILAAVFSRGLSSRGLGSWISATVVVWLVTAAATLVPPKLILRNKTGSSPDRP